MLDETRKNLEQKMNRMKESLEYIENKQAYYDDALAGEIELTSSLFN